MSWETERHESRDEIVRLFIASDGAFISGERLSEILGLSRTAVWKQIKMLERIGFQFESSSRIGYRAIHIPDELMPPLVERILPADCPFGNTILWAPERTSTNAVANQLAQEQLPDGSVVVAGRQTGGRGRQGRPWQSPSGGMWFSLLVRRPCALSQAADLTLLASVAVCRALTRTGANVQIKWPNDILIDGRKVCGILAQMRTDGEQVDYAVIGIGINANVTIQQLPEEVQSTGTTLQHALGHPVHRPTVLADVLLSLSELYGALRTGSGGFHTVRDEWVAHAHTLGRRVQVKIGDTLVTGTALDVDDHGVLTVRDEAGLVHAVHSGEVLFSEMERMA